MKYDRWDIAGYDRAEAARLFRSGINPLISVVLASRQILDGATISALLEDKPSTGTDPFSLRDMDAAVRRIRRAIEAEEHVAVYGDYDVDGITATCLLSDYLESKGLACEVYIPNRLEEGYGIRKAGLDSLHALGVSLVITVDCGITAVEEAEYARSLGMELVITDHHECGPVLPGAAAVVDPKRKDNPPTETGLAGVGVAGAIGIATGAATVNAMTGLWDSTAKQKASSTKTGSKKKKHSLRKNAVRSDRQPLTR